MPATRPPADRRTVQQFPQEVTQRSRDPIVAALNAVAKSQAAQAKAQADFTAAIQRAVDILEPGMNTLHGFGERLDGLCAFMKKRGPWILGAIPGVLVAIQAISPQAAKGLQAALVALGAQ